MREIADNRRALLSHRANSPQLDRITKDPWCTGPFEVDVRAMVVGLAAADAVSVRIDPDLDASIDTDGVLGAAKRHESDLVFSRQRKQTAQVSGSPQRVELLAKLVTGESRMMPADLLDLRVPRDLDRFDQAMDSERKKVTALLDAGRDLVENAERLVCRLYGLPPELEEAVVAHAEHRAQRSEPA